ncbi:hypothetical protein PR202_ga04705 [Eleusine coracana subsp. coracana]|uniref:Plus3 domain-containing protein n=1 Tax=Eleusine coracana subsp. coracana TaxID=191504 RepID=A0AAV5BSR4_ELECO|nr:hypothetical protein PR202_ga04705 [Eleusine coracana subsp. coracana]
MGRGRPRRGGDGSASASGRKRPLQAIQEEEEVDAATGDDRDGEDLCFVCKDGGQLRVCDFSCVAQAEFTPVLRKTKGFCINCLKLEKADFTDRETYEFLFKDYWEIVKDKEGLTLDKLEEAYAFMRKGLKCKKADLEKVPGEEHNSDSDFLGNSDDGDAEECSLSYSNGASKKIKSYVKKGKLKKNGHMGWGSEALIEFLSSVGKDISNSLDQFDAAQIVKEYIKKNNLQKDKKLVICDDKLKSLFRKSKLRVNRICSLLTKHITANMTSDDETLVSSEDNNDSAMTKKARTANYVSSSSKCTSESNKRCFASLVSNNIKLIYLKRSLVMDLLKEPDTFESKVTGCFVRVKNDPKDYNYHMHGKLHQLGQITGIQRSLEAYKIRDMSTDVLLCISNMYDVKISLLSEEDFEEGELEEKAKSIRRDIMSHIGYLNEKKRLCEHSERQRLLEEVPQVIPDTDDGKDTKLQVTAQDKSIEKSTIAFQATKEDADGRTAGMNVQKKNTKDLEANAAGEVSCAQKQDSEDAATKADANGDTRAMHVERQINEGLLAILFL